MGNSFKKRVQPELSVEHISQEETEVDLVGTEFSWRVTNATMRVSDLFDFSRLTDKQIDYLCARFATARHHSIMSEDYYLRQKAKYIMAVGLHIDQSLAPPPPARFT